MKFIVYPLRTLLVVFLMLYLNGAYAQNENTVDKPSVVTLNKVKFQVLGVVYEHEHAFSSTVTGYGGIGLTSGFLYGYDSVNGNDFGIAVCATAYVGFRNYYNLEKRAKANKQTRNNSGNYFGAEISALTVPIIQKDYDVNGGVALSPFWGFQRSIGRSVNFDMHFGPSLVTTFDETRLNILTGNIGFSILL